MRIPIRRIEYRCDRKVSKGLCSSDPKSQWFHDFESNSPLYDTQTGKFYGRIDLRSNGIHDADRDAMAKRPGSVPAHKIGALTSVTLKNGRVIPFKDKDLYVDKTGTRIFVL